MGDNNGKIIPAAPATFRFGSEATAKFKEFCDASGMTQAQGFDHLIQILELNQAKEAVPERLTEIEDFERHAKALTGAYLTSLEINANAEARIREQFQSSLVSKDKTIAELQESNDKLKTELETEKSVHMQFAAETEQARKDKQAAEKRAEDIEKINRLLSEKLANAEILANGYSTLKEKDDEKAAKISDLENQIAAQKASADLEMQKQELKLERAVMEKEREMQDQIREACERAARAEALLEQLQGQMQALTAEK